MRMMPNLFIQDESEGGFGVEPGNDAIGLCERVDGEEVGEEVAEWSAWVFWEGGGIYEGYCVLLNGLFGDKRCRRVR